MRKKILLSIPFLMSAITFYGQTKIKDGSITGTSSTPNANAVLELESDRRGLLMPRLTQTQRDAMTLNQNDAGMSIFNTSTGCYNIWLWNISNNTGSWTPVCGEVKGVVEFEDCSKITVVGVYDKDQTINNQNVYINVPLKVVTMGTYSYSVDINGITFVAKGVFNGFGPQEVKLFPSTGTAGPVGIHTGSLSIAPTVVGNTGLSCSVQIKFISRSTSVLKIVNVGGNNLVSTSLTTCGSVTPCSYSTTTAAGKTGAWLSSVASSIGGVQSIQIINVAPQDVYGLSEALIDASIVYLQGRQNSQYKNGTSAVIADWYNKGKGIIIEQGDEDGETPVAEALGYYMQQGTAQTATLYPATLPKVFQTNPDYTVPFPFATNITIQSQGSNGADVTAIGNGKVFGRQTTSQRSIMYFDDSRGEGIFILGDKYGGNTDVNTEQMFKNIFAWAIRNAPVHN